MQDQMKIRLTQSSLTKHWAWAELVNFQSQKIRAASKISELWTTTFGRKVTRRGRRREKMPLLVVKKFCLE